MKAPKQLFQGEKTQAGRENIFREREKELWNEKHRTMKLGTSSCLLLTVARFSFGTATRVAADDAVQQEADFLRKGVRVVDLYEGNPPSLLQLEFNYTRRGRHEGMACKMDMNGTDGIELFLENTVDTSTYRECEPVIWYNKDINCDVNNNSNNLCAAGGVNYALAEIKLDGSQSCIDAVNAMNMKYSELTDAEVSECGSRGYSKPSGTEGGVRRRRLNICQNEFGTCKSYSNGCGTNGDSYRFNWAFYGVPSTGQADDLTLHHHAWKMQDNITEWSNYPSSELQLTAITCLERYQRVRFKPGVTHEYYEGNRIWKCRCMSETTVHTRGLMTGNFQLDTCGLKNVRPTDTCTHRRRVGENWSIGHLGECQIDVVWNGSYLSSSGPRSNPTKTGWT